MVTISELDRLLDHVWRQLTRALHDRHSPYRLPTLATIDSAGAPAQRMVVLRSADRLTSELGCYTDFRSAKVHQLSADPRASLLFWDKKNSLQVRATGMIHLADREKADRLFEQLSKNSRTTYATRTAPGTPQSEPTDDLPPDWEDFDLQETDFARTNFQPLLLTVNELDVLQLGRPSHLRAKFTRTNKDWQSSWVTP